MKAIELSRGMIAVVDDQDFLEVAQYKWSFDGNYAVRRKRFPDGKLRKVYLHREIMGSPAGMEVDHINHFRLDCRRENMRVCTRSQNAKNGSKMPSNKSGYKGVHFSKQNRNWVAQISCNGKMKHLGSFKTAEDASRAYNTAALELHREFANTN